MISRWCKKAATLLDIKVQKATSESVVTGTISRDPLLGLKPRLASIWSIAEAYEAALSSQGINPGDPKGCSNAWFRRAAGLLAGGLAGGLTAAVAAGALLQTEAECAADLPFSTTSYKASQALTAFRDWIASAGGDMGALEVSSSTQVSRLQVPCSADLADRINSAPRSIPSSTCP